MIVILSKQDGEMFYELKTPNHRTGNLITNLARLCSLPLSRDENGLKVIRGQVPAYIDAYNRLIYIFRMGNTSLLFLFVISGFYEIGFWRILNFFNFFSKNRYPTGFSVWGY